MFKANFAISALIDSTSACIFSSSTTFLAWVDLFIFSTIECLKAVSSAFLSDSFFATFDCAVSYFVKPTEELN